MYDLDELTGLEEHQSFSYSSKDEWHRAWHRDNGVPIGQPGCPEDACDGDPEPVSWSVTIDSPNLCDHTGPCGPGCPDIAEPPF